jgi:hypothetical protein
VNSEKSDHIVSDMRRAIAESIADLELLKREAELDERAGLVRTRVPWAAHWAWRAATRKRLAEVEFLTGEPRDRWRQTLTNALNDYSEGLRQGVNVDHWILGQYCVLETVLEHNPQPPSPSTDLWWNEACRATLFALQTSDPVGRMWAHSTMADLLMVSLMGRGPVPPHEEVGPQTVLEELQAMVAAGGGPSQCLAIWPTFRQFWRWHQWWLLAKDHRYRMARAGASLGYTYLYEMVEPRLRNWIEPDTSQMNTSAR